MASKLAGLCAHCNARDVEGVASALEGHPGSGDGSGSGSAGSGGDGARVNVLGAFSFPFAEHAAASHCWKHTVAEWQVRGATYLSDSVKVPSQKSIGDCIGVELLASRAARIDNVGARAAGRLAHLAAEKVRSSFSCLLYSFVCSSILLFTLYSFCFRFVFSAMTGPRLSLPPRLLAPVSRPSSLCDRDGL